jgi:hypothetical protein
MNVQLNGRQFQNNGDKLVAILQSKRIQTAIIACIVAATGVYGMDEQTAMWLIGVLAAYIAGESIAPSLNGYQSKRFIGVIATMASAYAAKFFGYELDPQLLTTLGVTIISLILGDSVRELKPKAGGNFIDVNT